MRRSVSLLAAALLTAAGLVSAQPVHAVPVALTGPGHTRVSDLPKADTAHLPVGVHAPKGSAPYNVAAAKTACSTACYFYSSFSQGPGSGLLAGGATANFTVQST